MEAIVSAEKVDKNSPVVCPFFIIEIGTWYRGLDNSCIRPSSVLGKGTLVWLKILPYDELCFMVCKAKANVKYFKFSYSDENFNCGTI